MNELEKKLGRENLSEKEIQQLLWEYPNVYEEAGEMRRWQRSVSTVVKVNGEYYRIDWEQGLTEAQDNDYYQQPVKVRLKERAVIKTEVVIIETN